MEGFVSPEGVYQPGIKDYVMQKVLSAGFPDGISADLVKQQKSSDRKETRKYNAIKHYVGIVLVKNEVWEKIDGAIKSLGFLICSILITTLMVSDPYIDIFTFQEHSNRGASSVLDDTNETLSGTKWDYATQWSFHPIELISFIFPYHFGLQNFSVKNRTNPSEFMKQASYWGYMPFTQSTHYMGLLVLLLPLISLGIRFKSKDFDKYEIFLWLISIIFLIIGFGKHFPIFYQILFDYAPFFSKFRIPSMIYLILIFTFTYLASASLDYIIKSNKGDIIISSKLILGSFIIIC